MDRSTTSSTVALSPRVFLSLLGGKSPPPWPMLLHQARMTSHLAVTKGSVVCRVQPAAYSHDRRRYSPFSLFPPSRISIFVKLGDESSQSFCSAERREASHDGSIRDRSTIHGPPALRRWSHKNLQHPQHGSRAVHFSPPTTPWVKRVYVTNVPVTKGSVVCRVQPAAYSHDMRRYNPFSLFPPSRISIFADSTR